MKSAEDLRQFLRSVDRKGYPAYKGAKGVYQFPDFTLSIDHVQGDPFASPSRVSIRVEGKKACFPAESYHLSHKRVALQDLLLRKFAAKVERYNFKARGSGKSGLIAVSRCGQEILERTACVADPEDGGILIRMEVGFPANGRTINSGELIKILFEFLPECVAGTCFYKTYPAAEKEKVKKVSELAEDQEEARRLLSAMGLTAFVANGSILPRESGVSDRPMAKAVPFTSPSSMEVVMKLPHAGRLRGWVSQGCDSDRGRRLPRQIHASLSPRVGRVQSYRRRWQGVRRHGSVGGETARRGWTKRQERGYLPVHKESSGSEGYEKVLHRGRQRKYVAGGRCGGSDGERSKDISGGRGYQCDQFHDT